MQVEKTDIITRLRREILPLEGLRMPRTGISENLGLGFMSSAFPLDSFPLGAVHEFISDGMEGKAATTGFISGLLGTLMKKGGAAVWISSSGRIFPPALKAFGIVPDQLIFIHLHKEKDLLWATEEALKCDGLAAVIGELPNLSFTASRRFQLAVEQSRVTGFILRAGSGKVQTNAAVARWRIETLPSFSSDDLPGLGHPRWQVQLIKIRNGKPGIWTVEWSVDHFHEVKESRPSILLQPQRKTG